jgi:hypothetical protein
MIFENNSTIKSDKQNSNELPSQEEQLFLDYQMGMFGTVQNFVVIMIGILLIASSIFLIQNLTIVSVLLGIDLFAISITISLFEIVHPVYFVQLCTFWFSSLLARSILLSFLSLVACYGLTITGAIAFILSMVMFIHSLFGGKVSSPLIQKPIYTYLDA